MIRAPRQPGSAGTTPAVKIAVGAVAPLIGALAVLGGIGSFATLRRLAAPWFGPAAWIVPAGIDLGILALLAWDLLAEYLGLPWPVLRWTAWAFIAATVYLNIAAARGDPDAAVMHAAMPVLFITVTDGIRHLIRQRAGLASGTRTGRIPGTRWLLAPRSTFLLARRMILWQITSYPRALALEHQRLAAVARLQEAHGRYRWHWKAPLRDRLALRLAATGTAPDPWTAAPHPTENPKPITTTNPPNDRDRLLITTATEILRDADRQGIRLSQGALARRLRAQGHAIANDRLRWLITATSGLDGACPVHAGSREQGADA